MKNLVENKKLKENIIWYKKILQVENLPIYRSNETLKPQTASSVLIPQSININPSLIEINNPSQLVSQETSERTLINANPSSINELKINQLDKTKEEMNPEEKLQFYDSLKENNKKKTDEEKSNLSHPDINQTTQSEQQSHQQEIKPSAEMMKNYPRMNQQEYMMYMQAMQSTLN
jgi:predicted nucleotidyltransferase